MRALSIDPSDAVPIWKQIEDGIRRLVASGALAAGGSIPSVRDLARARLPGRGGSVASGWTEAG